MVKTGHKVASAGSSTITSVGVGAAMGIAVALLLSLLLTSLVMNGRVGEDKSGAYIFAIRLIGGFVGCMLATVVAKRQHLIVIGLTGAAYLIILLAVGIVFYEGSFAHFGSGLLSVLIGCGAACIIRLKPPTKKKYKHHRGR